MKTAIWETQIEKNVSFMSFINGGKFQEKKMYSIGDDISIKSSNVKLNINNVCNLIRPSSEQFN